MENSRYLETRRWAFIFSVLFIGLVSLIQPGCDCSSSSSSATPPPISSVFPEQSSDTALVSTVVSATFSNDMNPNTIDSTTFFLTQGGAPVTPTLVEYNSSTRTATLTPLNGGLTSGLEYRATITTAVQDINGGNPVTIDRVWSFTISPTTVLVSKNENSVVGNNRSGNPDMSFDGRYVVFESMATNLTTDSVTNNRLHIYRKDTITGELVLVSSDADGLEANKSGVSPKISNDGRYVVFESEATNLGTIPGINGTSQIYLKDLDDGSIDMISRTAALAPGSADSLRPDISGDGSTIVFETRATNLACYSNFASICLVEVSDLNTLEEVSVDTNGNSANGWSFNATVSDNGQRVVFESNATNLVAIDTNGSNDIFLRDRSGPTTSLISVNSSGTDSGGGASINAMISGDGSTVVFESLAKDLTTSDSGNLDVFHHVIGTPGVSFGTTSLVNPSTANANSINASVSADGTYVAFESNATNLGASNGFTNIYVRDITTTDALAVVSRTASGALGTDGSYLAAMSPDGLYVGFNSVFGFDITDANTKLDVYRAYNSTYQ